MDHKGLAADRTSYFGDCIRQAFPEGRMAPADYLPLVVSRSGPDPDDHVHSAAAVAGAATVLLSPDDKGFPPADISPARRRHPEVFLTELLRRYPLEVTGTVDAMGAAMRDPLTREQVIGRLAAAGVPNFATRAAALGYMGGE